MIVVFGGTGTLGHALAKIFHKEKKEVTIISRCELKQKNMSKLYPDFRYIVGDVRDDHWKRMVKPSIVYNLAAMKHVDTAEFNTEFCYDVNVNGTINTLNWALDHDVEYGFTSTDKAVLPINAYGASKMMAEKHVLANNRKVFTWGNILGSRGSVLHMFRDSLLKEKKVYITSTKMTRFWMHIDDAAGFMYERMNPNVLPLFEKKYIPKIGAAKVIDLAKAVSIVLGIPKFKIVETGIRPGEKYHELLSSNHTDCVSSKDGAIQYNMPTLVKMVRRAL
jgi:UDP-N-acetylglucosamine 4,6-dehydratase